MQSRKFGAKMKADNVVQQKIYDFAVRAVRLYQPLSEDFGRSQKAIPAVCGNQWPLYLADSARGGADTISASQFGEASSVDNPIAVMRFRLDLWRKIYYSYVQ